MFAGNFAPAGWAFCNGALIPISENDALFNLIGTTYGGDGQNTFGLPDLQGRVPVHQGNGYTLAENGGVEQVTLSLSQYPAHSHPMFGTANAGVSNNANNSFPGSGQPVYSSSAPHVLMNAAMDSSSGGSQPHSNLQPFLVINFVISLFGIFPSQT